MGKFWIENELVEKYLATISGSETKVLLAISRHYNKEGTCFPSIRRLSRLVALHPDTVAKSLRDLEMHGFLQQLVIKEKCKLRYFFTKTAGKLLIETNQLPVKPGSKEELYKDVFEEVFSPTKKLNPEELERIRLTREKLQKPRQRLLGNDLLNQWN